MLKSLSVVLALAAVPAAAFDIEAMSDAERTAFGEAVRGYLMENPGVLMEAIGALEARQAEAQVADDAALVAENREALVDDGYSWVTGNPDGDVTMVEFMDYRCGYCRRAYPEVAELVGSDGDIRLVIKEFPILGEQSMLAAQFAMSTQLVLGAQAYEDMHDALMTMRADVTEESLRALAETEGYDADAILAGMADPEIDRRIETNRALGTTMGISGTPSFVIGDQMVRGFVPLESLREIVETERADG